MRTAKAANADSNSYYRIHWPEMKVQEVVDTINKLRRESTPDYKSVDAVATPLLAPYVCPCTRSNAAGSGCRPGHGSIISIGSMNLRKRG